MSSNYETPTLCISSSVMGGLGNQLFQIFTTIAYGIKYSRKIIFPEHLTVQSRCPRHTYWESFLKHLFIFTTKFVPNKINEKMLYAFPVYQEGQGFSHIEIPEFKMTNVRLNGYFQSYKYFEKYMINILNLIKYNNIRNQFVEKYKEYLTELDFPQFHIENTEKEKCKIVSIHFRLGDYKTLPDYHPILSYVYYIHAIEHVMKKLQEKNEKVNFLVFCQEEDFEIVNGYFEHHFCNRFPEIKHRFVKKGLDDWEELILMSMCDHHIIANSTFSWWGAYLGEKTSENSEKIICYPDMWFGFEYMNQNTSDLFPPNWTKIDAGMPHYRFTWN